MGERLERWVKGSNRTVRRILESSCQNALGIVASDLPCGTAYLPGVTVSIRVMTAGQGFRYLLNSVVVGDGDRDVATALTRYYEQTGTP